MSSQGSNKCELQLLNEKQNSSLLRLHHPRLAHFITAQLHSQMTHSCSEQREINILLTHTHTHPEQYWDEVLS